MASTYGMANNASSGTVSFYQSLMNTLNWIAAQGSLRLTTLSKSAVDEWSGPVKNESGDYLISMDGKSVAAVKLDYTQALFWTHEPTAERATNPESLKGRLAPAVSAFQKPPVEEKPKSGVLNEAQWVIVIRTPSMHGGTDVQTLRGTVFDEDLIESAFEAICGVLAAARAKQKLEKSQES